MRQNDHGELAVPNSISWRWKCWYWIVPIATLVWLFGIAAGMYAMLRYAHDPGALAGSPIKWPAASGISQPSDQPVLLLFAHPRCPCTRASLGELERLTARHERELESHVVFVDAPEVGEDWIQTDLRQQAQAIRGTQVFFDRDAVESERFRARTSGLALLYSGRGVLLFEGGITPSRGHEGSNPGIAALEAIIRNERPSVSQTSVFGCPLQTPALVAFQGAER